MDEGETETRVVETDQFRLGVEEFLEMKPADGEGVAKFVEIAVGVFFCGCQTTQGTAAGQVIIIYRYGAIVI